MKRDVIIWTLVYTALIIIPLGLIVYFGFFNHEDVYLRVFPSVDGKILDNVKVFVVYRRNIVFHGIAYMEGAEFIHFRRLKGIPYVIHIESDTFFFPNKVWSVPGTTKVSVRGIRRVYRGNYP